MNPKRPRFNPLAKALAGSFKTKSYQHEEEEEEEEK